MRSGCEPDVSGANDPAPAEDVLNENPSLVALGKIVLKWSQDLAETMF